MIQWPNELPQTPLLDGFSETIRSDATIIGEVEIGIPKKRPRYTAVPEIVSESYLLDKNQFNIFKNFYITDLRFGADKFLKQDPISEEQKTYRFIKNYEFDQNGIFININIELEKIPL